MINTWDFFEEDDLIRERNKPYDKGFTFETLSRY
jgi:hypothetical protein